MKKKRPKIAQIRSKTALSLKQDFKRNSIKNAQTAQILSLDLNSRLKQLKYKSKSNLAGFIHQPKKENFTLLGLKLKKKFGFFFGNYAGKKSNPTK